MTRLTLEQAKAIIDRALARARDAGSKPLAVVVLDDAGHVKAVQREDGASMFRVDIAHAKAWGAVGMGEGSRGLAKRARGNPNFFGALAAVSGGRMAPNPGGVLIRDGGGGILGAVGISGDTGDNDEAFAVHGIGAAGLTADPGAD